MKFALIGQDIPMLLPTLLRDLLFAGNEAADVAVQENNPAMQGVLKGYMDAIYRKRGIGGEALVSSDMQEVLAEADCVVFADDCMPASRFRMDREALSGEKDDDPGLSDQARVNGGIGGLMHTLRCGEKALSLCDDMSYECPDALVINLAQPMARICAVFENAGFRCYGLGRTPLRGPNGLEGLCHALHRKPNTVNADIAGLPGFAFLLSLTDAANGADLLPAAQDAAEHNDLGPAGPSLAGLVRRAAHGPRDRSRGVPARTARLYPRGRPAVRRDRGAAQGAHSAHEYRGRSWRG